MSKYHIPDPFLLEIGERVRKVRKVKGVTLRQLGEMCEMDFGHISRLENGQKDLHLLTLKKLADKLDIDVKDLL